MRQRLDTDQKALEINLNDKIYGTFAEIGAGQEVARHFFKVGAAAGTVAKSMSAYDKTFSDRIYGMEESGRYVCISRLYKMLDHEYDLMVERIGTERADTNFFVFADTVSAIDYHKTVVGRGWLGLRFQLHPDSEPNELLLHVRMLDNDNLHQQEAIGVLGVNMLYGCYHYHEDFENLLMSLGDGLKDRVIIDMVDVKGPDFQSVDKRLIALWLVKHGLSKVAMFDHLGEPLHPSEFLYKKSLMVVRGNYRPPTTVTLDVFKAGFDKFCKDINRTREESYLMAELTIENLTEEGRIDEEDYLSRVDSLCALGFKTILSDCSTHRVLLNYLSDYKIRDLALVIGSRELHALIKHRYDEYSQGGLLIAMGEFFSHNIKVYIYPAWDQGQNCIMTSKNLKIPEGITHLYTHLLESGNIIDLEDYEPEKLKILPPDVLSMIRGDKEGWDKFVPTKIAELIKENCLFGYPCHPMEFEI